MTSPNISAATLEKLAKYDSPTICNVIELFEVQSQTAGYMDGRIRSCFPEMPPMVGFAVTGTFRGSAPGLGSYDTMAKQLRAFQEVPGPSVVVWQDLDDPPVAAVFGEVMCSLYKAAGSVGLVTSGGGRDLSQVRAINFPVFTGSTIVSHGYPAMVDAGIPVRVGGLIVKTGDLLHGDENGVTSIPLEIAAEVADVADEFMAAESILIDFAQGPGEKSQEELQQRLAAVGEALGKLKARVSRKK